MPDAMGGSNVLSGDDIKMIALENLEPNKWNPQVMTDVKFNELVEEVREDGFDEPIHVVKHPDPIKSAQDIFMIINGEHRWQAARVLGILQIPCVIKANWKDEKTQKIKTVRRNMLHGDLDKTRFTKLVHGLNDLGVPMKELPGALGFENEEAFREKFIAEERERQEKAEAQASKSAGDQERQESTVVENLSFILNEIFSEYGDTIPQGFVFFWHKNACHLMVQMDEKLETSIKAVVKYLQHSGKNINPVLKRALGRELDSITEQEGEDPRKLRDIKKGDAADDIEFGADDSDSGDDPSDLDPGVVDETEAADVKE